ncbi:MAG: energy-coupling factor transporter transmembrane protein EcfT [Ruminococcaceae bacterium]|nr:energy-coupling factor transporter transmembrane protein EcfT [Oscillospiraceae bacterium]
MDNIKNQVMKNAYGNADTVIAKIDPRVLMVWYLFFAIVPWFVNDLYFLLGSFLLVMITTIQAKVAPLVIFLFALGVFSQTGWLLLLTFVFGGDGSAIIPLLILTLKVSTVSLASVTVFSGMDPDNLAKGLMWMKFPGRLSFSISYAYRILPTLISEFQNILLSYRMRGMAPKSDTFKGKIKYVIYQVRIIIDSFYPLLLNTAKRSRTTVEALEIKGYTYASNDDIAKKLKLSTLKIEANDLLFLALSFLWLSVTILVSSLF